MKKFSANMVAITNLILLLLVYLLGVGISSIVAKIIGKKFLDLKKPDKNHSDKKVKSYWIQKERKKHTLEDSYRQF